MKGHISNTLDRLNEGYKTRSEMDKWACGIIGADIASRLNCHYDGIQPGFGGEPDRMQFTDNVTHSTTYGNSYEEVKAKLEKMREAFKLG